MGKKSINKLGLVNKSGDVLYINDTSIVQGTIMLIYNKVYMIRYFLSLYWVRMHKEHTKRVFFRKKLQHKLTQAYFQIIGWSLQWWFIWWHLRLFVFWYGCCVLYGLFDQPTVKNRRSGQRRIPDLRTYAILLTFKVN